MNKFENASRIKLRFDSGKGQLAVEDLWGLSIKSLDRVGTKVKRLLREREDSMLPVTKKYLELVELKLSIVEYIIKDKQGKSVVEEKTKEEYL